MTNDKIQKIDTRKSNEHCGCGKTHDASDESTFELSPESKIKNQSKNNNFTIGFVTGVLITGILAFGIFSSKLSFLNKDASIKTAITIDEAKIKAETFINENLMQPGSAITIKKAEEINGLYKIAVNAGGTADIDTYITKDGKIFFPQAIDIEKAKNDKNDAAQANSTDAVNAEITKNDKPDVELFVMSHCPYGTQIEKGILPAVETLGSKINFDIKFTSYAMHGERELKEELNQYCIKTNEPTKYRTYLKCFIESASGDSETCFASANINTSKLKSCVAATDSKFKVMANFADKSTWNGNFPTFNIYKNDNIKYGVQGSPTLIVNGTTLNSNRDSASLLKTICSAFANPPDECNTELSDVAPAPGFGTAAGSGAASASCGN